MRVFYEVYGDAPTTFLLFPTVADLALAALEGADPVPLAPLPRRRVRPARERPVRPARRRRGLLLVGVRRRTVGPCWRRAARRRRSLGGLCDGGGWALMLAATDPAAVLGVAAIAPFVPRLTPSHPNYRQYPVRRAARHGRGLGEVQPPLLAARLPRLPRVLLRAADPRAALDEADRGLRPLGARGRRGVARSSPTRRRRRRGRARRRRATSCERVRCPVLVDPRRPRQLPDARACDRGRRADRRDARRAGGRRPPPAGAPPGEGERPPEASSPSRSCRRRRR